MGSTGSSKASQSTERSLRHASSRFLKARLKGRSQAVMFVF
jgi:hypothetical protein